MKNSITQGYALTYISLKPAEMHQSTKLTDENLIDY